MDRIAMIAFVAKVLAKKNTNNSIYSYENSKHYNFSINSEGSHIVIYDYTRNCFVSGGRNGDVYSIYDFGEKQFLNFTFKQNGIISIYDFKTSSFFNFSYSNSLALYSFKDSKFYNFS